MLFGKDKLKNSQLPVKRWHWFLLIIVIAVAFGIKAFSFYWPKARVQIGGQTISVLVADTSRHQYLGWGGRKDMGKYQGMLFVFSTDARYGIVMRNMNFAIDIVWLDDYKIVDMAPQVQPESGSGSLTEYTPRLAADMVLELPAGFIKDKQLKIGDEIKVLR